MVHVVRVLNNIHKKAFQNANEDTGSQEVGQS